MRIALAFGFLVGLVLAALAPGQSLTLRSDGVGFPDGTVQTTAAIGLAEAWPQRCDEEDVAAGQLHVVMTCFDWIADGPTTWSTAGVPAGHHFLVTDVMIHPAAAEPSSGRITVTLLQSDNCAGPSNNYDRRRFVIGPDLETRTYSASAPMMTLPPGHCLRLTTDAANSVPVSVWVTGYLTTEPTRVGR